MRRKNRSSTALRIVVASNFLAKLKSSHRKQKKGFGEVYERRLGWRRVLVVRKVTKTANR
jgi:hypothetical protein